MDITCGFKGTYRLLETFQSDTRIESMSVRDSEGTEVSDGCKKLRDTL